MKKNNKLTIFIISSGEESFDECLMALRSQTVHRYDNVKIEIIENVYPMSEAFNEMHRRCTTKFFVQVDADMVLNEDAVEKLYKGIKNKTFFTYASYGQLYEEGFGVGGSVRCWRKSFFKFFLFKDCRTVDRNLYGRARRFGFHRKNIKKVIGIHKPRHSSFTEYLKTKSDIEKWRFLKRAPEIYAIPLIDKLLDSPSCEKFRIFGAICGALTPQRKVDKSKNMQYEKILLDSLLKGLSFEALEDLQISEENLKKEKIFKIFSEAYLNRSSKDELIDILCDFFGKEETENHKLISNIRKVFSE